MKKIEYEMIDLNLLENKNVEEIDKFLKYRGSKKFDDNEIQSLKAFIKNINSENRRDFILSYVISHIDKEFDIIKANDKFIINVEMKNSDRDYNDRLNQVKDNYTILKKFYPNYHVYVFSYVSDVNELYLYDYYTDNLIRYNFDNLNQLFANNSNYKKIEIEYIIKNVYQEPKFFLENNYFLSNSQKNIKENVLNLEKDICIVDGRAGTGKSLLAMDIYKTLLENNKKVRYLIPSAVSKIVDIELLKRFKIIHLKDFLTNNTDTYDYIIVNEAQRVISDNIIKLKQKCNKLIMFVDYNQDLDGIVTEQKLENYILKNKGSISQYSLNQSIRSDGTFVKYASKILGKKCIKKDNMYFDKNKIKIYMVSDDIEENLNNYFSIVPAVSKINPCYNYCNTKRCLNNKFDFNSRRVVHFAISNEYDNVALYLCEKINAGSDSICSDFKITYGDLSNQLYTIITRARKNLVIICQEIEVYNYLRKCVDDLSR